jgi:hypothetical protein
MERGGDTRVPEPGGKRMSHRRTIRAAGLATVGMIVFGLLASCNRPGPGHDRGTLQGHVTSGPTCPVESIPPDPRCADRPVADAPVEAVSSAGTFHTRTDREGSYTLAVPAGVTFTVTVGAGRTPPSCPPLTVTVPANETVTRDISCDSGIR